MARTRGTGEWERKKGNATDVRTLFLTGQSLVLFFLPEVSCHLLAGRSITKRKSFSLFSSCNPTPRRPNPQSRAVLAASSSVLRAHWQAHSSRNWSVKYPLPYLLADRTRGRAIVQLQKGFSVPKETADLVQIGPHAHSANSSCVPSTTCAQRPCTHPGTTHLAGL